MLRNIKACLYRNGIDQPGEFFAVVVLAVIAVGLMVASI